MRPRYLLAGLLFPLILFGCDPIDHFTDFREVNLIKKAGFSSGQWALTDTSGDYLRFQEVTDSAVIESTADLPNGADDVIYRLEILNLMPNGDFEEEFSTVFSSETLEDVWDPSSVPADVEVLHYNASETNAIDGRGLEFTINKLNARVDFDLNRLNDGFIVGGLYMPFFDFRVPDVLEGFYLEYNDGVSDVEQSWLINRITSTKSVRLFYPNTGDLVSGGTAVAIFASAGINNLSVGGFEAVDLQHVYLDNFRFMRTDLKLALSLEVPYQDEGGDRPDLVSGLYRFTFYVKRDPTNTLLSKTDVTKNRFPARAVTVEIQGTSGVTFDVSAPDDEVKDWKTWQKIVVDRFYQIEEPAAGENPTEITIFISPQDYTIDPAGKDAGSGSAFEK